MNNRNDGGSPWLSVLGKASELAVAAIVAGSSSTVRVASFALLGFVATPGSPRDLRPALCGCTDDPETGASFPGTHAQL